jgi:hypothetical protein
VEEQAAPDQFGRFGLVVPQVFPVFRMSAPLTETVAPGSRKIVTPSPTT